MRIREMTWSAGIALSFIAVTCANGVTNEEVDRRIHSAVTTAIAQFSLPAPIATPITFPSSPVPVVMPSVVPPTPQPTATPQPFPTPQSLELPKIFDEIITRSITVVDGDGVDRISLSVDRLGATIKIIDKDGERVGQFSEIFGIPSIGLNESNGDAFVEIIIINGKATLSLNGSSSSGSLVFVDGSDIDAAITFIDKLGIKRFEVGLDSIGEPHMVLFDANVTKILELTTFDSQPLMVLSDQNGSPRLFVALVDDERMPSVLLADVSGALRSNYSLNFDGQGFLSFTDENGIQRVILGESSSGVGELKFYGPDGATTDAIP